jgi:hypothetical protein
MSLQQVNAFYQALTSDSALYEEYLNNCGSVGFFGQLQWDTTKIMRFAATKGYDFTENELHQVWFGSEDTSNPEESFNSSASVRLSDVNYQLEPATSPF